MIRSIIKLILISIFVAGCHHAGSQVSSPVHFGKITGQAMLPSGSSEKVINVTITMAKYCDSLRSQKDPRRKIDSSAKPITFHSDSLGFISEDSISPGRYELTFDGEFGQATIVDKDTFYDADKGLLTLILYDFRVAPDSISIINVRMQPVPLPGFPEVTDPMREIGHAMIPHDSTIKWIENIIPIPK